MNLESLIVNPREIKFEEKDLQLKNLIEWWKKNKDCPVRILILPNGAKIIDGQFFFLIENYGITMVKKALQVYNNYQKYDESQDNAFSILFYNIIPLICLKEKRMNINKFNKEMQNKVKKELAKNPHQDLMELKIKIAEEI